MPTLTPLNEELAQLEHDLGLLHRKYGMDDSTFLRRFSQGELGDDIDFQVWESSLQLREELLKKTAGAFQRLD
jgi:hypothetical protein